MPIGKLKIWNESRGFGFLCDEDGSRGGKDTFVHISHVRKAGIHDPALGDVFEFAIGSHNGREEAVALARISRAGD